MNIGQESAAGGDRDPSIKSRSPGPPAARLGIAIRRGVLTIWENLGLLVAASVTWAFLVSLPLSIERWLPNTTPAAVRLAVLALAPILAALPTAGVFSLAHRIAIQAEVSYAHLWRDGAALFGVALRLILIQTAAALVGGVALSFYLRVPGWAGRGGIMISGYGLLLWAMMLVHQWPALIIQESGGLDEPGRPARRGAAAAVRRSFFLALGAPFYSLALLGALLCVLLLACLTIVLPALIGMGAVAAATTFATRALLVQFRALPAPVQRAVIPDEQFRIQDAAAVPPRTDGR